MPKKNNKTEKLIPAPNSKNAKKRYADIAEMLVQLRKSGRLEVTNEKISLKDPSNPNNNDQCNQQ